MSLREAVEEVAAEMESAASGGDDSPAAHVVGWVKCLRTACKAAGPDPAPGAHQIGAYPFAGAETPSAQEQRLIDAARREAQEARRKGEGQEAAEGVMTECRGGPADTTYAMRPAAMPEGAKTFVGNAVYELCGGVLVFVQPQETKDGPT